MSDIIRGGTKRGRLKRCGGDYFSVLMRLELSDLEIQVHHREVCARVRGCVRALNICYRLPATPRAYQGLCKYFLRISCGKRFGALNSLLTNILRKMKTRSSLHSLSNTDDPKFKPTVLMRSIFTSTVRVEEAFVPPT